MADTRAKKRAYWANHVGAWKVSGQTQSGYCRQHSLKPHQLTYWVRVFKDEPEAVPVTPARFVPVQLASPGSHGLTLHLSNGLRLEGIHAGNLSVVREIVGWWS